MWFVGSYTNNKESGKGKYEERNRRGGVV